MEDSIVSLESELESHRTKAQLSHQNYLDLMKRSKDELVKINELEQKCNKSSEEEEELRCMKHM